MQKKRLLPTRMRTTPAKSSRSNGAVESQIGHTTAQARTMKAALEAKYGIEIHPGMAVWTWLPRHAA